MEKLKLIKKISKSITIIIILINLKTVVFANLIDDINYMEGMIIAAHTGDVERGRELEKLRNDKIDACDLAQKK